METIVRNHQFTELNTNFQRKDALEYRIISSLRKIGCVHFVNIGDLYALLDVKFSVTEEYKKNSFLSRRKFIIITIQKNDLPENFDYFDFSINQHIIQFEVGMPVMIYEDCEMIFLEFYPGRLFYIS